MKARLIQYYDAFQVLLCTGKIVSMDIKGAHSFLLSYDNPSHYSGPGKWEDSIVSMAGYEGQTIATVNDNGILQIHNADLFRQIMEQGKPELVTVQDYADRHQRDVTRVRKLCREGRILGAMQLGTVWLIPENAPYPSDERLHDGRRWSK